MLWTELLLLFAGGCSLKYRNDFVFVHRLFLLFHFFFFVLTLRGDFNTSPNRMFCSTNKCMCVQMPWKRMKLWKKGKNKIQYCFKLPINFSPCARIFAHKKILRCIRIIICVPSYFFHFRFVGGAYLFPLILNIYKQATRKSILRA